MRASARDSRFALAESSAPRRVTPSIFSSVGIDPERKHILVVKSTQHFHAGFAPISKQVLYAGDLGALPGDMLKIPLLRADTRNLWPFVDRPLEDRASGARKVKLGQP